MRRRPKMIGWANHAHCSARHAGSTIVLQRSRYSQPRCALHGLLSAAMTLCLCALGAGRASADSSGSIVAGHSRVSDAHSCRCNGCRGAESCCCSGTHEPDKKAPVAPPAGSGLASAPCVGAVPCGEAPIPDAGSRTRVPGTAILAGFHRPQELVTRRLLGPLSTLAVPPEFVSRLEDPPEGGPSLISSR
jgi:hypothetical protein